MPLTSEEISKIRKILGREPTDVELAMFEAQWSEHCSYKSSREFLKLLPTAGEQVIIGPGRDAPAVRLNDKYAIVFKVESHNHPSAIDPYNGASTGVGGIVRDILTLGARPIALLDLLFLGDPRDSHALWLIKNIVRGIGDYGNRIGVPVVAGTTWFDESFNRQPLVNVACVGIVELDRIVGGRLVEGDLLVLVGNTTGRDGLLGSSFASRPLDSDSDRDIAAVQVGNPLLEKILIDALLELAEGGLVKYIKDLGGGGLVTALSELAFDHGLGADVYADSVHVREPDMSPLEIMVSESQERMLLVVGRGMLDRVKRVLDRYELQYSMIGELTSSGRLRVIYRGMVVADVSAAELARPRSIIRPMRIPSHILELNDPLTNLPEPGSLEEALISVLSSHNVASKRWIYEQYDHEVGLRTVVKPGSSDASVLRILDADFESLGVAVKGDGNPRYTYIDPFHGSANVVSECYRNLVAVGSRPLAIVDEINAGNPEKPDHYWYFVEMVKGVAWISKELGLPVVGGKISFYNEDLRTGRMIKPTATIVGVGVVEDVSRVPSQGFVAEGDLVAVVGVTYPELGGSEYLYRYHGVEGGGVPHPRPASEILNSKFILEAVRMGLVRSVHDVDLGGLAVSIAEMSLFGGLGVDIDLYEVPCRSCRRLDEIMFSESQARYVVAFGEERLDDLVGLARSMGVDLSIIGRVGVDGAYVVRYRGSRIVSIDLDKLGEIYDLSLVKSLDLS